MKIWHSWTLAVILEFTKIGILQYFFAEPPSLPKKPTVRIFLFLQNFNALIMFFEFPEVVIANKTSPGLYNASKFLLKISSKS